MDRQRTNEGLGSTTDVPKHAGETVTPDEAHPRRSRPSDDESEQGVVARGAEAAREASRDREGYTPTESASGPWHGQEVADAPFGEAEDAAARAAGRGPGNRPGERLAPDEVPEAAELSPEEASALQEQKRQAAAEQHEADRAEGSRTSPKNL